MLCNAEGSISGETTVAWPKCSQLTAHAYSRGALEHQDSEGICSSVPAPHCCLLEKEAEKR